MIQAAFWFAIMALLVRVAGELDIPTMQTVLARGTVTLALSALGLWRAQLHPFGSRTGMLLLRGLFGSGGLMCFYSAVNHLPLAEASVIHQISPVLTAIVAALWLGERLQPRILLGMGLAFAGVIAIAKPVSLLSSAAGDAQALSWPFVLVGVLGALFASLAYVAVRTLGRTEPPLRVVLYFPIVTVPIALPFAIAQWTWPDWQGWLCLLGVGVSTQLAQIALTKGLAREPAGRAMAVAYLQVAFAMVFGALWFAEVPDVWSWLGTGLIVGSLFVAARR